MGRLYVTPVDPATRRTLEKAAKSICEPPYGPPSNAIYLRFGVTAVSPVSEAEETFAKLLPVEASIEIGGNGIAEYVEAKHRAVNPWCALRMKTRSP